MRASAARLKTVALWMVIGCLPWAVRAQRPAPADPRLEKAYQQLHFGRLYPPESVREIQDKLQSATDATAALANLAGNDRHETRVLVAILLGDLGDPEGAKTLWKLMRDDESVVRMAAAGSLLRLSYFTSVPVDTDGLNDSRPEVRRWVATVLGDLRERGAEGPLIEVLKKDTDPLVRQEAATALGKLGERVTASPALIQALQDRSVLVRDRAAFSLGRVGDWSVISALSDTLKDEDWHVRASAAFSMRIWTARNAGLVDPIADALKVDEFALVRDRSAQALGLQDNEHAIDALVHAMITTNRAARFDATETIIGSKAVLALPRLDPYRNHPNPDVRENIMKVYGALGGAEQMPAILEALRDEAPTVRLAAVNALRKIRERGAAVDLERRLSDEDPHVRAATARALGELGEKSAVPRLVELLRDEYSYVRSASAEALGKLGDRSAVPSLVEVLTGAVARRQQPTSNEGLGLVIGTGDKMLPELSKKIVGEKIVAVQALEALHAVDAVDDVIQHGLKAEDAGLRAQSAIFLGKSGEQRAVGPLQDAIRGYYAVAPTPDAEEWVINPGTVPDPVRQIRERESRVRSAVVWALGQLHATEATPILKQATEDVNSMVRDAANEALAKIQENQEKQGKLGSAKP